ncbi:trichohyalin-like [Musca vetustissima]|uniref:trichohyalin-like n=1 Tax=Musca vetustissima TaxID=27455 RepID=UPI002AB779D0|nr:trichohyalin-like [Musca vetustissima]
MSTETKKSLTSNHKVDNKKEESSHNRRNVKPIVLSSQRYNKIISNATTMDKSKTQQQLDEEKQRLEKLKEENDKLVAKFKGNMQRTQEQKMQQIKDDLYKKTQDAKESYEQTKENEAQKRREKIAKAQQLIEKLKPGPRQLHTAALQSEVLRARNVQRDINEEFKKAVKKQECEAKIQCQDQAMSWINEEQQRLIQRQKNANAYKEELLQTIHEKEKVRNEQKKHQLKEQQLVRTTYDVEMKAQMERERVLMEKKREAQRKNALEAMKMVEQRRMREKLTDEVEDRLCCVYNAGKRQLDALRTEQTKKIADDQQQKIEEQVKKLSAIEDNTEAKESERVRRDISTMQLKFTAEEQEKIRKDKAAKKARIEAYLKEMEQQKEARRRADEEKRFEMAQRFKNEEVNQKFAEKQQQERLANAREMREFLHKQIEENQRNRLAQKQANITCNEDKADQEDKFFFDYAKNLIEDAQQKGRPLYPFAKAVNEYKKENDIECERKIPKHMETHIAIGRAASDTTANDKDKSSKTREEILQNCLKINEILTKSSNSENPNETPQKPLTFLKNDIGNKLSSSNDSQTKNECSSMLLRYSMEDLKKLNQYAAPSCH